MEIKIVTDGDTQNTELYLNGVRILFKEFDIMGSLLKKGRGIKMQLVRPVPDGVGNEFISYYGGDFKKMDELSQEQK